MEAPKGEFDLAFIPYRIFLKNPHQGLLRTDSVPEEGEDVIATIRAAETLSEEEQEELRRELAKVKKHSFWNFMFCTHNILSFVFLKYLVMSYS